MTTARVIVLVLIGVALGSVTPPVQGQTEVVPFVVGQRLTLTFGDRSVSCRVVETRGSFVRCEVKPDPFRRFPAQVTWYNIATVTEVSVRESEQ